MTANIIRLTGIEAHELIYPKYLSKLSEINQDTMLRTMRNSSRVWLGEDDGNIVAVWGLVPPTLLSDVAYLWLFTTEHLRNHTFVFIRHSQRAIKEILKEFPTIIGHTMADNRRGIQWLRWLGAEFGDPIHDNTVLPFTIKASDQWVQQHSEQSA